MSRSLITYNGRVINFTSYINPANPLWNGLYTAYKAENNANDELGVYNGTAVGGLTYGAGKDGNSFVFNGTNSYVSLPNSSFDFVGDFSISVWVKIPSAPSSGGSIFRNDNYDVTTAYGYALYVNTSSNIGFYIGATNGTSTVTSTTTLALNTWYYVTIKRDSVAKRSDLYINGVLEAQATNTNLTISYGTRAIQPAIGAYRQNNQGVLSVSNYLNGTVDELYIWDRLITTDEITELYNSGVGTFY